MLRPFVLALAAGSLLPVSGRAQQASSATRHSYAFCTVTDTSRTPVVIWASPVVPLELSPDDTSAVLLGEEIAGEFLTEVGSLGGAGTKNCVLLGTQAEAMQFRAEQQAPWAARTLFGKLGDWRDVAWAPAPRKPGAAADDALPVTRYFQCHATQTRLPDRSALSRTVASGVFARPVPAGNATAKYDQAAAYAAQFQSVVQAHGLPVQGSCMPYDTPGEAQHAYQQLRKLADGYNQKYTELAWTPGAQAPAVAEPVVAAATAPVYGYCTVSQTTGNGKMWVSPVFAVDAPASPSALAKTLAARFMTHVAALGGQGEPACWLYAGQGLAEAQHGRDVTRSGWRSRTFAEADDWRDVDWTPDKGKATATAATVAATSPPPAAATTVPQPPAEQGLYCTASVSRADPALAARFPVRKQASPVYSEAAAKATLFALIASVKQSHPGDWHALDKANCYDNGVVLPGEQFCVATGQKLFGGGTQLVGLFCNATRAMADKRWEAMTKADGNHGQVLAWPGSL